MGKKLAIKGHVSRGKEVIELLEMMGGSNKWLYDGSDGFVYFIEKNDKYITYCGKECIKNTGEYIIYELEEFLEKFPYKVGDKVYIYIQNDDIDGRYDIEVAEITSMRWNPARCKIAYKMKDINREFYREEIKCKAEESMEDKKLFGTVDNSAETKSCTVSLKGGEAIDNSIDSVQFIQSGKIVAVRFNTQNYENEVELQLDDYEIEIRNGKTYAICKKPKYKYPTTYKECCDVLSIAPYYNLRYHTYEHGYSEYAATYELCSLQDKLNTLGKLLICRDAYWKIAGEEMGLDKPWEPDWNGHEFKYGLKFMGHRIEKTSEMTISHVICFPTAEMRDAFYENFKDLIEQCKELL